MGRQESWNDLPCGEGREQLIYYVVPIQLGPNMLQGKIAKPGQTDLSERAIDNPILSEGVQDEPCLLGNRQTWESTAQPQQHLEVGH